MKSSKNTDTQVGGSREMENDERDRESTVGRRRDLCGSFSLFMGILKGEEEKKNGEM